MEPGRHRAESRRFIPAVAMVAAGLNVLLLMGTVGSAYAGMLDPVKFHGAGIAAMCYLPLVAVTIVFLAVNVIVSRKLAAVNAASLVLTAGPLLNVCPLNMPASDAETTGEHGGKLLTVMTMNAYDFQQYDVKESADGKNATLAFILNCDPDIVILQESQALTAWSTHPLDKSQIDSLNRRYPYHYHAIHPSRILSIYSKFEGDTITTGINHDAWGDAMCMRVNIGDSVKADIIDVHLQSLGLTGDDKALYRNLTKAHAGVETMHAVRRSLVSKLDRASVLRAQQALEVSEFVADRAVENVILAGDFNDVPGCYSLRQLEKAGLREVYPEVGLGPMITYHANRFLFRIDHVMYRGGLKPLKMIRHKVRLSDHYPITTVFEIEPIKQKNQSNK